MTNVIEFINGLADGGAETLVRDYALLLDKNEFDVTVLTLFPPQDTANYRRLKNGGAKIQTVYPKVNLFYRVINKFAKKAFISARLKRIMKKQKTDVLHVHMSLLKYLPPVMDALQGKKVFYTCHSFPQDFFGGKKHRAELEAAKKLFNSCDFTIIAIAESFVDELNKMFGVNNTVYLHNGINLERFAELKESKAEIRRELGIKEDAFVVGNVGRFVAYKNREYLLKVFAELRKTVKNAFLLILGDGELQSEISDKIKSAGLEDCSLILSHREDIQRILHTMDVFVYTAWYEGLGLVMIEAQAAGLRCVVSDTMQRDVFISDRIFPVSLDAPETEWCRVIIEGGESCTGKYSFEDFDMKNVIKQLGAMYCGE